MEYNTPQKTTSKYLYLRGQQSCTPVKNESISSWNKKHLLRFLPVQSTPPSSMLKVRNPFDKALLDRLHLPVCSPSVFSCTTVAKSPEIFEWTIEEISDLQPTHIEPSASQFESSHGQDPEVELKAQQAIDAFFQEQQNIVPSPLEPSKNIILQQESDEYVSVKRDGCTQTELTLPPDLPEELELALKPYFTYTGLQQQPAYNSTEYYEAKDVSLRRKLFCYEPVDSSDQQTMDCSMLSPVCSPIFNLKKVHGIRNHGTPLSKVEFSPMSPVLNERKSNKYHSLSPPLSPISKSDNCNSLKSPTSKTNLKLKTKDREDTPLCQSTPEKKRGHLQRLCNIPYLILSTPKILSSTRKVVLNEAASAFGNSSSSISQSARRSHAVTTLNFSGEDMSVESEKSIKTYSSMEPETMICESTIGISFSDENSNSDTENENLQIFSPMQTSTSSTPSRKKNKSAKNLSQSFGIAESQQSLRRHSATRLHRIDSGFTETFDNVLDSNLSDKHYNEIKSNPSLDSKYINISNLKDMFCKESMYISKIVMNYNDINTNCLAKNGNSANDFDDHFACSTPSKCRIKSN